MNKIIEVKNLSKVYNQAHEQIIVLENVNLEIKRGEFISIVGPSGSGKTTFLNIIGLLDNMYSGTVSICGENISFMEEQKKAFFRLKNIGFVFQFDSLLPEFNIIENIEMPSKILGKSNAKVAIELLKRFNLEKIADKMPLDISGGEKQRIAILRALRNNPQIVIADEPTGNLDKNNAKIVLDDFKKINKMGITIIMVTHNEEYARNYSDTVYHLESSNIKKI